jgi:hypothetical protein
VVYRPAWENVGVWNVYYSSKQAITRIPPIAMDKDGNVHISPNPYLSREKVKRKIAHKIRRLEPGLLKA